MQTPPNSFKMHGTTILAVRHQGRLVLAGDGQVSFQNTVIKHKARKVRRIFNDQILLFQTANLPCSGMT